MTSITVLPCRVHFDPIFGPEYNQRPIERILAETGGRKSGQAMRAPAKIYRTRRQHNRKRCSAAL
jgi:hypothetical protein